jgi:hypothetical protein
MKKTLFLMLSGLLFNSCAFIIYNYHGQLNTEYTITYTEKDNTKRILIGKYIYTMFSNGDFYTRKASQAFDSLYFYGPDYHSFRIRLQESNDTIKIHLRYVGHHGFRSRPPHKILIETLTDSLKTRFNATQITRVDVSNEK